MAIATMLCQWASIDGVTPAELDSKIPPCTCWLSIFLREAHGSLTDSVWRRLFWKFIFAQEKALGTQVWRWGIRGKILPSLAGDCGHKSSNLSLPSVTRQTGGSNLPSTLSPSSHLSLQLTWSPPKDNIIPGRDSQMRWIPPVYQRSF